MVAAIALIAVSAGAVVLLNNNGSSSDDGGMKDNANAFIDSYRTDFGPFELEDGSDSSTATVSKQNDSERLPYSKIIWTNTDGARAEFANAKTVIDGKTGMMGSTPKFWNFTGFEDATAVSMDVQIGTTSQFTLFYFAVYNNGILVKSVDNAMYLSTGFATDAQLTTLMQEVAKSIGISTITMTERPGGGGGGGEPTSSPNDAVAQAFANIYAGAFGAYTANAGVATRTDGDKSYTIAFTNESDAAAKFNQIKNAISTDPGTFDVHTVDSFPGLDGAFAFMKCKNMGGKNVSMLYIVAYKDNVVADGATVLDGSKGYQYKNSGEFATVADINLMFADILAAIVFDPAHAAAQAFADSYSGAFGTYTADAGVATRTDGTKSYTIAFTSESDAAARFNQIKNAISTDPGTFEVTTVNSYSGFDGAFAFMKCRTMGSANVSMLYIVAYKGDIVIDGASVLDGSKGYQYKNTGDFATLTDINEMFSTILSAL